MRPWIWWALLIVAPPVWFLLITLRFAPEILSVICMGFVACLGFWFITAALTANSKTTWVKPASMDVYKNAISECAILHRNNREQAAECAKARFANGSLGGH
jgi:hypothetical protein